MLADNLKDGAWAIWSSALIASGMDVLTISRRLGHGSPVVTLKVYGHLFKNTDARAAEIMQAAFAKGANRLRTETPFPGGNPVAISIRGCKKPAWSRSSAG